MDYFIKILDIAIWPAVVLTLVFGFRHELAKILARLSSVKFRDLEAKFERELREVESLAGKVRTSPPAEPRPALEPTLYAQLMRIAEVSPRAAISEAWRHVETAATAAAETAGLNTRSRSHVSDVVREFIKQGIFSNDARRIFDQLRQLRNEAVHASEFELDQDDVARYIELALRLEQDLFHAGNASAFAADRMKVSAVGRSGTWVTFGSRASGHLPRCPQSAKTVTYVPGLE